MSTLKTLPRIMNSAVFQRFFQLASYAKLTKEERTMYDISLKRKWDAEAVRMYQEGLEKQLKEAIREAKKAEKEAKKAVVSAEAQGEHKKAIETALKLREMSLSLEQIAEATGLTINEIEKLK
jgi:predicted transposase/invertase (TIGR01784 family)